MLLVANSTPIVDFDSKLNSFRVNLDSKFDFPTPESPIKTTVYKYKTKEFLSTNASKTQFLYKFKAQLLNLVSDSM